MADLLAWMSVFLRGLERFLGELAWFLRQREEKEDIKAKLKILSGKQKTIL